MYDSGDTPAIVSGCSLNHLMRVLFSVNDLKCLDFIHFDGNARIATYNVELDEKTTAHNACDTRIMCECCFSIVRKFSSLPLRPGFRM